MEIIFKMAIFSDELFNVFDEEEEEDKKPKKKIKRPNAVDLTKLSPESVETATKKPKVDFGSLEGEDDDDGDEKMEEGVVKEDDDTYVSLCGDTPYCNYIFDAYSCQHGDY